MTRFRPWTLALALLPLAACGGTRTSLGPYPPGFVAPFTDADLTDPQEPLTLALPEPDLWGPAQPQPNRRRGDAEVTFPVRITMRTGERVEGRLEEVRDGFAFVHVHEDMRAIPMGELAPRSAYTVRRLVADPNDAESQLALGDAALEVELWQHAAHHFKVAANRRGAFLARASASLTRLRERAAEDEITRAQDALDDGQASTARRLCVRVLRELPETPGADAAAKLVARIDADRVAQRSDARIRRDPEVVRQLSKATDLFDKAQAAEHDAFTAHAEPGTFTRELKRALAFADDAAREIERVLGRHDMTPELRRATGRVDADVDDLRIEIHLTLASMDLIRDAFDDAREHVAAGMDVMADQRLTRMGERVRLARDDAHWHGWYLEGDGPSAIPVRR